jgi:hypothetical protein
MNLFPLRISQGQLNLLETCPPKFKQVYLEQLTSPPTPEQIEKQHWGSQFHLLMQQRELGLPITSLLDEDDSLKHSLTALVNEATEILTPNYISLREAEHSRSLPFRNYLLNVVYDLLIMDQERAQIIDWKTYLQPENKQKLAKNWQTRLYLYVLAETSDYLPEQISMTYWFVKLPHQPQHLTFSYSSYHHQQTQEDLTRLLNQLERNLELYYNGQSCFEHLNNCEQNCPYYNTFLGNNQDHQEPDWQVSLDDIEEISL